MRSFNPLALNARPQKPKQEATPETQRRLQSQAMLKRERRVKRNTYLAHRSVTDQYPTHWLVRKHWE